MHHAARHYVAGQAKRGQFERVLEIGSRDINGAVRDLFPGADYTGIDSVAGPGVDKVADGATYKGRALFDAVVCCEVLEHTEAAPKIIANAHRNLRKGGVLILTTATDPRAPHSAMDGGPLHDGEFYRNISRQTLRRWLKPFSEVEIDVLGDDIRATAVK
jgi:SAM-dependent methyltransferase